MQPLGQQIAYFVLSCNFDLFTVHFLKLSCTLPVSAENARSSVAIGIFFPFLGLAAAGFLHAVNLRVDFLLGAGLLFLANVYRGAQI